MVEWLAGNRIRGTSTERTSATGFNPVTTSGGWKELGRTTFGGGAKEYSVSSLDNKRYYMILVNNFQSGQTEGDSWKVNSTSGNEYSGRESKNGDVYNGTMINKAKTAFWGFHPHSQPSFAVGWTANFATKEKLGISKSVGQISNVYGATNPPDRGESEQKWANTSNSINEFMQKNAWNNYNSGSEMVVLGWDPADTHTTNFWEELASVDLSGGASNNIDSGTITAKKYLWIQIYAEVSTSCNGAFTFNSDTGSNYAIRVSANGGTDGTWGGLTNLNFQGTIDTKPVFQNAFIINNSANEKLMMGNNIDQGTAGEGNPPNRKEYAGKWVPLTNQQITSINYKSNSANTFGTNSFMKVWGSD